MSELFKVFMFAALFLAPFFSCFLCSLCWAGCLFVFSSFSFHSIHFCFPECGALLHFSSLSLPLFLFPPIPLSSFLPILSLRFQRYFVRASPFPSSKAVFERDHKTRRAEKTSNLWKILLRQCKKREGALPLSNHLRKLDIRVFFAYFFLGFF